MSLLHVIPRLALLVAVTASPSVAQRPLRSASPVIVIDPEHSSEGGSAWQVAGRLQRLLTAHGYRVILTRTSERAPVSDATRDGIANAAGAALVVRLRGDAGADGGYAIRHPDRAATARRRTGATEWMIARSSAAAESMHVSMVRRLAGSLRDGGVHGESRAAIGTPRGAGAQSDVSTAPVILIELATLGDARDARFITSPQGQSLVALAIAEGVGRFVPASNTPRVAK